MLNIDVKKEKNQVSVRLNSDLNGSKIEGVKEEIKSVLKENYTHVIIDMINVTMIDSNGIGLLVSIKNTLEKINGNLEVINLSDELFGLFKSLRLDTRFTIKNL